MALLGAISQHIEWVASTRHPLGVAARDLPTRLAGCYAVRVFRILPALIVVGGIAGCIDRSPLEARQCGACPDNQVCVDGYCRALTDAGDVGDPDVADVGDTADAPDLWDSDPRDADSDEPDVDADSGDLPDLQDIPPSCIPTGPEVCDGADNDCDGQRDNVAGLGSSCIVGDGACRREGLVVCDAARQALLCTESPGLPNLEICNGIDDDCDGETDNLDRVLGAGCDPLAGAAAACVEGSCTYSCTDGVEDANGDLGLDGGDGCECQIDGDDVCDGIDNDCDGMRDPVCCDEDQMWSVQFSPQTNPRNVLTAGYPDADTALVAWKVDGALRYIVVEPSLRPAGPVQTVEVDAELVRVAASHSGFALAWWDTGAGQMRVRLLDAGEEVAEEGSLHDALEVAPRDIDIAYTEDDEPQLGIVWSLADCEGVCARTGVYGGQHHNLSFVAPARRVFASGRGPHILVVAYLEDGDEGGRLYSSLVVPGAAESAGGDDLTQGDGVNIRVAIAPTAEGWVVAFANGRRLQPLELMLIGPDAQRERNRNLSEFGADGLIALALPADHDRIGMIHVSSLLQRSRFVTVNRTTLGYNDERTGIFGWVPQSIGTAALGEGLVLAAIRPDDDAVRLSLLDGQGRRFCP